jgi:radical SAM superfamily enzyme YgiQ (UPF0313 family)
MKIRRIVLVEPKSPGKHVWSIVKLPRLGLPILGTIASLRGIDARVVIEEQIPVDFSQIASADLLCLSTTTSTAPAAYQLAARARMSNVPVVIGGPHVSFLPDEALDNADWVLRGECDQTFGQFLDMLEGNESPANVPGLSYFKDGQKVHNDLSTEPVDMDSIPMPDFNLFARRGRKVKFPRGIIPIQTSRGCPHHCRFCSVTPMFGHKLRFRSIELVAEELESRRGLGDGIFFYDDNFCGSPTRAKKLLDHLLTKNIFLPPWAAQVSVRAAKDLELLKLMQRARTRTVFVGFESVHPDTLDLYHKRQTLDDIRQAIRRFHQHGIWVHGMFVTGSDADGIETIRATSEFALQEDIDSIQFMVLTPLPGTPVFDDMAANGRLLTRDWSKYDAHYAVFRPNNMSPAELSAETMAAMGRVYNMPRVLGMLARGKLMHFTFNYYAHRQVKKWQRDNRVLVKEASREAIRRVPSCAHSA